mmetsp:Transcript_2967/g.8188  ORF Transcript_2967/g.8188 Transcript_2967/m.8188 type:complete len:240 (+) Transcript_2967:220-939(+)
MNLLGSPYCSSARGDIRRKQKGHSDCHTNYTEQCASGREFCSKLHSPWVRDMRQQRLSHDSRSRHQTLCTSTKDQSTDNGPCVAQALAAPSPRTDRCPKNAQARYLAPHASARRERLLRRCLPPRRCWRARPVLLAHHGRIFALTHTAPRQARQEPLRALRQLLQAKNRTGRTPRDGRSTLDRPPCNRSPRRRERSRSPASPSPRPDLFQALLLEGTPSRLQVRQLHRLTRRGRESPAR